MEDNFNDIFEPVKNASLSESERVSMRNNLLAFIEEHPVLQPLHVRIGESARMYFAYFSSSTVLRPVAFAFALVAVIGVGTSYAAEGALPGDPLYAVKIHVKEKIQGALAISTTDKVEWNADLLDRRLSEAETLAADGRLTASARAEIETRITETTDNLNTQVADLAKTEEGSVAAASAQSRIEAAFVGHGRVLAALSREIPESEPTIRPILAIVRAHAEVAEAARSSTERTIAAKDDSSVRTAAADSRHVADSTLNKMKKKAVSAALAPKTTAEASTSALAVEQAISAGDEKLKNGEYGEAFGTYQAALRAAHAVEVNLDAEERLGTELSGGSATTSATSTVQGNATSTISD